MWPANFAFTIMLFKITNLLISLSSFATILSLANSEVCITDTNGPQMFNNRTHLCCANRVSMRLTHQECCGNEIIDTRRYICCGDQRRPRLVGKEKKQICCGPEVIFDKESLCCGGIAVKLTKGQNSDNLQCCRKGVIANLFDEECCGGEIVSLKSNRRCCGEETYNISSHWCDGQNVILGNNEDRCNDKIYTVTEKTCCSGVLNHTVPERDPLDIHKLNKHSSCCGTKVIDPALEQCCWESETNNKTHSIPKGPTLKCCGNGYFDTSCQVCSDGHPIPKREGQKACGYSIINLYEEECCADYLRFNKTTEQCCRGSRSSIIPKNQKCCNGAGYNDQELCCKDTKPCPKGKPDDDACCLNEITNEARTYNTKRQKCNWGNVIEIDRNREVCGWNDYNPETHLCCKGWGGIYSRLVNKTSGYNQCCGSTPFSNQTQTCCFGKVFEIPTKNASCCHINYKAYNFHDTSNPCTQRCSGGTLHYDIIKETCCGGSVYPRRSNFACCGSLYFKRKDMIRDRKQKKRRWPFDCCGNRDIFSKRTSVCRDGELTPKMKGLLDTQAVCYRPLWRSVDGVVKRACTSNYGLVGKLSKLRILRKAIPDLAIVEMTLSRISILPFRKGYDRWDRQKKLKIKVEVPNIQCSGKLRRRMRRVAVFFNVPVQGAQVYIRSTDTFRIVAYTVLRKLRKYGIKKDFCSK